MIDLFVTTSGNKTASTSLLFLHGGMGLDHTYFRPFVEALEDDFHLVFFDHRLNGRSPHTSECPVDLNVMASDASAVAEHACRPRVVMVAHSFGAWVGLAVSEKRPAWLAGLVLVSPALSLTMGATLLEHVGRQSGPELRSLVGDALGRLVTDDQFAATWQQLLPHYLVIHPTERARSLLQNIHLSPQGFQEFLLNAFGRLDWSRALEQLDVPLLVVAGADDWLEQDPGGGSAAVVKAAATAAHSVLTQSGHFPFVDQPEEFCDTMRTWLSVTLP